MKKILLASAAVAVVLTGAVAMAQGGGYGGRDEYRQMRHGEFRGHGGWHKGDGPRGMHHGRFGRGDMDGRRGPGGRGGRAQMLDYMFDEVDADGDGSVTQEEIDGFAANRFAAMDADSDGSVTPQELADFQALQRAKRRIARLDQNDDGVLSIDELPDRTPPLARFDLDENGIVTKTELKLAREQMGRRMGRGRDGRMGPGRGMGQGRGMGPGNGMGPRGEGGPAPSTTE